MKTLYLEKRGCNFWNDEEVKSDINNYRVTTTGYTIKGKDENLYFAEFCLWRNKGHYRTITKNGKRELKKPVFEIDAKNVIAIGLSFEDNEGTWGDVGLEKEINALNCEYTKNGILKAVNTFSKEKYDKIEFVE